MVDQPTISANKLAEYLIKRAARQRKILSDRKYPDPDFNMGAYYRESTDAVVSYLAQGAIDTSSLVTATNILKQQNPGKVGTARRLKSNIDAIQKFEAMLDDIDFKGGEPEIAPHNPPHISFFGVRVSVRPEIIIRGTNKKGQHLLGAVKMSMTSGFRHTTESAGYVSAMVQEYLRQHVVTDEIVYADYCQVIDVGGESVFPGVKSTVQRLKDIEAECQNIAALWSSI